VSCSLHSVDSLNVVNCVFQSLPVIGFRLYFMYLSQFLLQIKSIFLPYFLTQTMGGAVPRRRRPASELYGVARLGRVKCDVCSFRRCVRWFPGTSQGQGDLRQLFTWECKILRNVHYAGDPRQRQFPGNGILFVHIYRLLASFRSSTLSALRGSHWPF
jgi:hypothetical protein